MLIGWFPFVYWICIFTPILMIISSCSLSNTFMTVCNCDFWFLIVLLSWLLKVILHQFWVKKIFRWKFNLEYGGTFIKLFMHVSNRNMFPTTRNLQIRAHVYHPRHCCGDWLTFGCFVPMIADHDLVKKSFGPMIAYHHLVKKR